MSRKVGSYHYINFRQCGKNAEGDVISLCEVRTELIWKLSKGKISDKMFNRFLRNVFWVFWGFFFPFSPVNWLLQWLKPNSNYSILHRLSSA